MPNRIIKESIKSSDEIDALSWFEEAMFPRLIVTVDDYGCYEAKPKLLRNVLFPLKDNVTVQMVSDALDSYEKNGLIRRYEHDGKQFLYLVTWMNHQRIRNKTSRYPEPFPGYFQSQKVKSNDGQSQSDDIVCATTDRQVTDKRQSTDRQLSVNCQSNDGQASAIRGLNPIQSNPIEGEDARAREGGSSPSPLLKDEEANKIHDHDEIFNALSRSGFPMSDGLKDMAVNLYAKYGKETLLWAIKECIGANGNKVKYLKGILRKGPQKDDEQSEIDKAWALAEQTMKGVKV